MNKVFDMGGKTPLTAKQLADRANAITFNSPFTADMFKGEKSRISGTGHCTCNGEGEFELLPISNPDVQLGGKRYMICRKCGCCSHL